METKKEDLRVKVKYTSKTITVGEGEEAREVQVCYVSPDKKAHKKGEEELVTRKHAIWLQANGFIEPLKSVKK